MGQSISQLLTLPDDGTLKGQIPDQIRTVVNAAYINDWNTGYTEVWLSFPPGQIARTIGSVQMRLVEFMIEIGKIFPDEMAVTNSNSEKIEAVHQSFINTVNANTVVISGRDSIMGSSNNQLTQIVVGDFNSLREFLTRQNVAAHQVDQLETIIKEDDEVVREKNVVGWVKEQADAAAEGVGDIIKESTKKAMTEVFVESLKKYSPSLIKGTAMGLLGLL